MLTVIVILSVLHEIEHGLHAVRPFRYLRISEVQDGIGELDHFLFQNAVAAEKHIVERHTVRRTADLQMSRPPRRHRVVHTIEPILHTVRRTGIRQTKNPEALRIFSRIFRRHGPQSQFVASGRQGGQFRHPHRPARRQLDAGNDLLLRSSFRRVEDVACHRHRLFPLRSGRGSHQDFQTRKRLFHQCGRQALQGQLQTFFRQGERCLRLLCLSRGAQDCHVHHLPEAADTLQPLFFHLTDRNGQDETSLGIGIDRIQLDRLLPHTPPIEPSRHVGCRRHAGRTQRHAVVVHGHPRQPQRVAGPVTVGEFIQGDFKRRPFVFLHRKGHHTVFRLHHVFSGQPRGGQGEGGGNRSHPVALHRLFRHGFPVRVTEFQRHLAPGRRTFLSAPLVRAQATHVHRLSGTVDGPIGIEAFRLPRPVMLIKRNRRGPSRHSLMITVIPLMDFHRKGTPVVLLRPTGGLRPADLAFRVRHGGMHGLLSREPFHGRARHRAARPSVQHGVETGAVRQDAAHQFQTRGGQRHGPVARRVLHAVGLPHHHIISHAGAREHERVPHLRPSRTSRPLQPLCLHEPAMFLRVCLLVLMIGRTQRFFLRDPARQKIPPEFHSGHVAVLHDSFKRNIRIRHRRKSQGQRRSLQPFLIVQQCLGPRIVLVFPVTFLHPTHLQRVRHGQAVYHRDINLGRQRQVAKAGEHLPVGLVRRRGRQHPSLTFFRMFLIVCIPSIPPLLVAHHRHRIQQDQQFRLAAALRPIHLQHPTIHG